MSIILKWNIIVQWTVQSTYKDITFTDCLQGGTIITENQMNTINSKSQDDLQIYKNIQI